MSTMHAQRRGQIRAKVSATSVAQLVVDESFWTELRQEFVPSDDFVQLDYGYYHPACRAVIEVEINAVRAAQRRGSHYKRNEATADREAARADLAGLAGADLEEIIITRNTTEALNIVIQGIPLSARDEVVCSDQDYPSMVEAWEQRARREGLILHAVKLPLDPASDAEIVERFAAAITPRTRVLFITHLINFTGHILPVAKLCALGRQHGLQVIVDAAHSFAQLDFTIGSLDCDYLAASLHKWLAAPLGLGMLYVRQDRIASVNPLFADTRLPRTDIRKLEHFGNRPESAHLGLREAILWHDAVSAPLKGARLHFLQRRWTDVARTLPRVRMLTPSDPARHGAIGTFSIEGLESRKAVERLMSEHGIFVNAIDHATLCGIRVTPGIPTAIEHIDRFIAALKALAGSA